MRAARVPKAVLDAVYRGWAVIPVGLDKRPFFTWREYQTNKPDLDRVRHWAHLEGIGGWAVITGAASGVVILDFDGAPGASTLRRLGLKPHVRTGSGGYHVLFGYPGWRVPSLNHKTKRELGAKYPGLDIRADGGYAVFYGRNERGEYERLRDLGTVERIEGLPLDVRKVLGLVRPAPPAPPAPYPPHANRAEGGRLTRRLLCQAADMVTAGEGRNNTGFWLAVQLRDNGFSRSEAAGIMREYQARCPSTNTKGRREAYTLREANLSLDEAYRHARREPWSKSK